MDAKEIKIDGDTYVIYGSYNPDYPFPNEVYFKIPEDIRTNLIFYRGKIYKRKEKKFKVDDNWIDFRGRIMKICSISRDSDGDLSHIELHSQDEKHQCVIYNEHEANMFLIKKQETDWPEESNGLPKDGEYWSAKFFGDNEPRVIKILDQKTDLIIFEHVYLISLKNKYSEWIKRKDVEFIGKIEEDQLDTTSWFKEKPKGDQFESSIWFEGKIVPQRVPQRVPQVGEVWINAFNRTKNLILYINDHHIYYINSVSQGIFPYNIKEFLERFEFGFIEEKIARDFAAIPNPNYKGNK